MSDQRTRREFLAAAAVGAGAVLPAVLAGHNMVLASESEAPGPAGAAPAGEKVLQRPATAVASCSFQRPTTYSNINQASWENILADGPFQYVPPLTVHLPIQPIHSRDFVYVDAALNACRRRVFPGVSSHDKASYQNARKQELLLVQFALDNPPFVPDLRLSRLSLEDGKYPVAHASYYAWERYYEFEYFCSAVDDEQSILWVCVSVTNQSEKPQPAHVWAKVNVQRECDLFDDTFDETYTPFYWDQSKWRPCTRIKLNESAILLDSKPMGKVAANEWTVEWKDAVQSADKQYNLKYGYDHPYFVPPNMRLKDIQDVIHFSTRLAPGEKRSFALALLVNYEGATAENQASLGRAEPQQGRAAALRQLQLECADDHTRMVFPIENRDKIFTELQLSTLQLLVQFPGEKALMPSQGGSLDRHFVWVWEAAFMLRPMLRLGHFGPVRRALDFIFSLQDGGSPPEGKLTTTAGAVGTTGPRWLNATGSALALAADYCLYSQDEDFLRGYMAKIVKGMDWIVGELRATRKLNADGTRSAYYGLMPFGRGTDADTGYIVAFTDAFTFWGLEKAVTLLERRQHPRAAEFRRELETYRGDLAAAVQAMTRPDGFIARQILTGTNTRKYQPFDAICGAANLAYTGCLDVQSEPFRRYVAYFEENLMDGFFAGHINCDVAYVGVGEFNWHYIYLCLGEWKKAFAAMRTNIRYGMTQDTYQVQERFSRRDPNFTPWQPNGSGNGRMLEMMLNCIYFEHDGVATLLGGVPFAWLVDNCLTSLTDLYTTRGKVSIDARMLDSERCRLTVEASAGDVLPPRIRLPEHFEASNVPAALTSEGGGVFKLKGEMREFSLILQKGAHRGSSNE